MASKHHPLTRSPWGREYAQTPTTYIWGTAPSSFATEVTRLLPPRARVLDLGCGEGRDSVFFAAQGYDVTGVDISRAGLRKAERLGRERGVAVRWIQGDVARLRLDGPFNLVYSCGSLHYVPRAWRPDLFRRLKTLTRPGGHHAHIVFTDRAIYVEKGEIIDYFNPGELSGLYADWILLQREDQMIACAQDGTPHRHSVEQLVARAAGSRNTR